MHDATLTIVRDEAGARVVVTHADDVIWITEDVWAYLLDPDRERLAGDTELTDGLLTFGTDGEGLGRLTYRHTGELYHYGFRHIVCERVEADRG